MSAAPDNISAPDGAAPAPPAPRLLDQVRHRIRYLHYSIRTERAYVDWARRFILFHDKRHRRDMGGPEVEAFLTYFANERNVVRPHISRYWLPCCSCIRKSSRSNFPG